MGIQGSIIIFGRLTNNFFSNYSLINLKIIKSIIIFMFLQGAATVIEAAVAPYLKLFVIPFKLIVFSFF